MGITLCSVTNTVKGFPTEKAKCVFVDVQDEVDGDLTEIELYYLRVCSLFGSIPVSY